MYLLHRKKIHIYTNISPFLSYSEVTVATRSGPYPAQMIIADTRSSPYPDQMVDQHLEMTSDLSPYCLFVYVCAQAAWYRYEWGVEQQSVWWF